jgi:putative transposase
LSGSGKAKVAVGVLEEAVRNQDLLRSHSLKLRSDNGLIFGARAFVREVRKHGIEQEFIVPYTPKQNGMIERFFRSLKEECIWLNNFSSFAEAKGKIEQWIQFYNEERPHQSLGYRSPCEMAPGYLQQVA